jgi:hypothetical protein
MTDSFQEFQNDDAAYLHWLAQHPRGFVINTPRGKPASYMVLHRATCASVGEYNRMARPGGFTERSYIKICAPDIESLRTWVRQHGRLDGSFSAHCSRCDPF